MSAPVFILAIDLNPLDEIKRFLNERLIQLDADMIGNSLMMVEFRFLYR